MIPRGVRIAEEPEKTRGTTSVAEGIPETGGNLQQIRAVCDNRQLFLFLLITYCRKNAIKNKKIIL